MGLTVLPTILFNASTGSDSAASGAGPGTALAGSAAAVTNASTSATIGDAVDLSGVAADGSAVLWINTASGRQFSRISTVSGSSGAWTLVLEDSVWTTSTGKTWGIGGKRATFADANSRKLFSADVKPGWTVQTETDQSYSTALACSVAGNATTGLIAIKGSSGSPRPKLITTANVACVTQSVAYWSWESLHFQCSSATRSAAYGFDIEGGSGPLTIRDCLIGDSTNKLQNGIVRGAGSLNVALIATTVHYCNGDGVNETGGTSSGALIIDSCRVRNNAGVGVRSSFPVTIAVIRSIVSANGQEGMILAVSNTTNVLVASSTVHGNGTTGSYSGLKITLAAASAGAVIHDNHFTGNSQYGINLPSGSDAWKGYANYNNFGTGSTANTSGAVSGVTQGPNSLAVDPGYADAASGDFTPSNSAVQAGLPVATGS